MNRFSRMFAAASIFSLAFVLTAETSLAQTTPAPSTEPAKPAASRRQSATPPPEKPAESAIKPEPSAEPRPAAREAAPDNKDKEEHYDVSEVPPLVTHHQITVDGKLLKYTATAGRLPIKRGDGKIEAEMFYVAYTLDGQDSGRRPLTFA
ncbi:MAG TPA: hypothetical protein VFL34_03425, partial [Candidatus Sulfotelmatobacter sp.]|nr:hypothetical protein [Candidatus Sulfotelmatobacter sp.]